MSAAPAFDPRELRRAFGSFVTGVTIVTTLDPEGQPCGMTVNSFSSVSLDPPLVLWSQISNAPSHPVYRDAERFVIHVLAHDQRELSNRFAKSSAGLNKFEGVPLRPGLGGLPLIEGCVAYFECRRWANYPGGDHTVFVGQVDRFEQHPRAPLAFVSGQYARACHDDANPLPCRATA